jgi:hypothetical protein
VNLLREYIRETLGESHTRTNEIPLQEENEIRTMVRLVLKEVGSGLEDFRSSRSSRSDDAIKLPEPKKGFIENIAHIKMKWAHRDRLLKAYDDWKWAVETAGRGNKDYDKRMAAFKELRDEIENPIQYMMNADKGAQYWVGLAALVPPQQSGEIMGLRMEFRQGFDDRVQDTIEAWMKEAAQAVWEKFSESPVESMKAVHKVWSALPDSSSDVEGELTAPTKAAIIGALVQFIITALGKQLLGLTGPLAILSAVLTLKDYFGYKSRLADMADKLVGDRSVSLSNQWLPPSLSDKGGVVDAAKGLAGELLGDPQKDADAVAYMRKAMGRD